MEKERAEEEKNQSWRAAVTEECLRPRGSGREGRERSSCSKPYRTGHGRELQHWHWGLAQESAWKALLLKWAWPWMIVLTSLGPLVLSSHGARLKRQKPGQAPSRFVAQVPGH